MTEGGRVEKFLPKDDYIIQIWTTGTDESINDFISKGFKTIFSNYDAWYLDCGYSGWVTDGNNWCNPYKAGNWCTITARGKSTEASTTPNPLWRQTFLEVKLVCGPS